MVVQIIRGTRSEKYAAKDWSCEVCGNFNKINHFLIFDLPAFYCGRCKKMYDGIIYFNLADVEVNGKSILPEVKHQRGKHDDSPIDAMDPMILADTYNMMFGENEKIMEYSGLHKMLYTGLILKECSRRTVKDTERATHSDVVAVNLGKFEHICQCIADGRGVVGAFPVGKNLHLLKFGEVYSPPVSNAVGHAVMLIGAIFYQGSTIYIFLNSWGKEFCALRDENGELIVGGIGMIEGLLLFNPIVLSRSWEKGVNGQLTGSWRQDLTEIEALLELECINMPAKLMPTFTNKQVNACAPYSGRYDFESTIDEVKLQNTRTLDMECNRCLLQPRVEICKDGTSILDGAEDKKPIEGRTEQLGFAIEESTSNFDKEKLQERLEKLSGGVAVLKIDAASEVEVGEQDRVTDAPNATKAAVEDGIVPSGIALLYTSKDLDKLETTNFDQKTGVQIMPSALKTPVQTIASNADAEGAIIAGKLLGQENTCLGYDSAKGEYVDMVKAGIIDLLKLIRTALIDAASLSSQMTTPEATIVELPRKRAVLQQ
ncbi:uncharacterized protein LOC120646736 isoform X3 [Panicum virgatum]|uniref:uncharacterized protein LOC120646736 isoform X3 n=1 Tax=Panicum virgatum TaxID=38727 RepID=UPI0019D68105|nr:uncharacterized protein LOC120646736 isoform X3 [Panicum virgatum]